MTLIKKTTTALLFVLIFSGADCWAGIAAIDKSAVIEPGSGIGDIRIGDDMTTVLKKFKGSKPEGNTVKSGLLVEYWLSYAKQGVTFIFDQNKKLRRIAVSNPVYYVEQKEIRPKASASELDRLFGKGKNEPLTEKYEQKKYEDQGLTFTIDKNSNRIETITIINKK